MEIRRIEELHQWVNESLKDRVPVRISGGFRGEGSAGADTVDLFELNGPAADTLRVLIPKEPRVRTNKPTEAEFTEKGSEWWSTWGAVLATTAIVPPIADPRRLADLIRESRRLRICCDTNGLAQGVVSWLLLVLSNRADVVTSAVVDRELAAWADKGGNMWAAQTELQWARRTRYRLARRLTETPPPGVVVDRLSPEQGALMLAKLRDETEGKSPDADMLLIELARGLVRDQPRNARVVYLTGDRNNARAATNALGAENVLFAISDTQQARESQGRVMARGWWRPGPPLGAVLVPDVGRLIWDLLAACDFLSLNSQRNRWLIRPCFAVARGVPSDWANPCIEIIDLHPVPSPSAGTQLSADPPKSSESAPTAQQTRDAVNTPSGEWILPPIVPNAPIDAPPSWRPTPHAFFSLLWSILNGEETIALATTLKEVDREAANLLHALGALAPGGGAGPRAHEFREAWNNNDRDWFHAEFLRLPGYRRALDRLRLEPNVTLDRRGEVQIAMARALGQVARLSRVDTSVIVGDAPISAAMLVSALESWLPKEGDAASTDQLCRLAGQDLQLTPTRLEIALQRLWERSPDVPFAGQTGGTVTPGYPEQVAFFSPSGFQFQRVAPGALSFGRSGTVRFVVRTR